jgi:hypothetical protein
VDEAQLGHEARRDQRALGGALDIHGLDRIDHIQFDPVSFENHHVVDRETVVC